MAAVTGYLGAFKIASDVTTTPISNENLGVGDDVVTVFYLDNTMPDWDNVIIRLSDTVSDNTMIRNVDYEISPRGVVTFTSAVSDSRRVQGDYSYFAAYTPLGGFTNWTLDLTCDMLDSTEFASSGWRTFKAGLKGWTGTAEGYWLEGESDLIALYNSMVVDSILTADPSQLEEKCAVYEALLEGGFIFKAPEEILKHRLGAACERLGVLRQRLSACQIFVNDFLSTLPHVFLRDTVHLVLGNTI